MAALRALDSPRGDAAAAETARERCASRVRCTDPGPAAVRADGIPPARRRGAQEWHSLRLVVLQWLQVHGGTAEPEALAAEEALWAHVYYRPYQAVRKVTALS